MILFKALNAPSFNLFCRAIANAAQIFEKKTQFVLSGDIKLCASLKHSRAQKARNPSHGSSVESHSSNRCFDAVKPDKFVGYPVG